MIRWSSVRTLCLACIGLLAACFTDGGGVFTGGGSTAAGSTSSGTGDATTSTAATSTAATATATGSAGGSTTGPHDTTAALTSGATTGGGATTPGTSLATTGDGTTASDTTGGDVLPVPGCQPLFFSDFYEDPNTTLVLTGTGWMWDGFNGLLSASAQNGSSIAWVPDVSWTDFTIHARFKVGANNGYNVLRARGQPNGGDYYFAGVSEASQDMRAGRSIANAAMILTTTPAKIVADTWYTMRVSVFGGDIKAEVVELGAGAAFKDGMIAAGSAGFGVYQTGTVTYDWFLVCAP